MPRPPAPRRTMLSALACSSGLHLLAAILLGFLLARAYVAGHAPRETISIATESAQRPALIAIERRERPSLPARQAARAGPVAPLPVAASPLAALPLTQHHGQRRHALVATAAAHQSDAEPKVVAAGSAQALQPQAASPIPATTQRPDAQPSPSAAATELGDVPAGGWGQNFANPLLADESALDDLRAKYHGSASVQVDETGHAVKVVINGTLTPDARAEIEKRLMALRYVPAECNGQRCGGTLQLAL